MSLSMKWLSGVPEKDKEARRKRIKAHQPAFDDLIEILKPMLTESTPDYDNVSWSHKQADQNGANRMLKTIIKLINNKEG